MNLTGELSIGPDDVIESWEVDEKHIRITLDGAYYDGVHRNKVELNFPLVSAPIQMAYDSNTDLWSQREEIEAFSNIRENFRKIDSHFSLKGFGRESGLWISLGFVSKQPEIFFQ